MNIEFEITSTFKCVLPRRCDPKSHRQRPRRQYHRIFNKPFNAKDLDLNNFEYDLKKSLFTFNVDNINFEYDLQNNNLV
jgi:hypothetical protein